MISDYWELAKMYAAEQLPANWRGAIIIVMLVCITIVAVVYLLLVFKAPSKNDKIYKKLEETTRLGVAETKRIDD